MEHKISHAKNLLLSQSGIEINDLNKILNGMMAHGVDYADLYFQYTKNEYWGLEEGQVKSGSFSIDQGVGVRAVNKDKSAFAYSDDISIEALLSSSSIAKAIAWITGIITDPEVGTVYTGKVKSVVDFGAFVEILPGKEGLLHISVIDHKRIKNVTDELTEGQIVQVKLLEIDKKTGKTLKIEGEIEQILNKVRVF